MTGNHENQIVRCVKCGNIFTASLEQDAEHPCCCGFVYSVKKGVLRYDFRSLLFRNFKDKYLFNAALNNNGYLSYIYLKEASLSLPSRSDVANFRDFIVRKGHGVDILDIGCGPLPMPGYLQFGDSKKVRLVGIDPIENNEFHGFKIIGTGEFIPLCDETFDTIVFGTSLDHVVSMDATIKECMRVLKPGGHVFVWMGDRSGSKPSCKELLKQKAVAALKWLLGRRDYPLTWSGANKIGNYYVYPDYTVFYIPKGAVDPFHSYEETPGHIVNHFFNRGFSLVDKSAETTAEVFLCFRK